MFYFTYLRTFFREGVQRLPPHGHPHQEPWIQRTFSFPLASASNTALFSRRLWGCFSWNPIPRFTGNQHQAGRRVALPSRPGWQNPCSGKGQRLGQHGGRVPGERIRPVLDLAFLWFPLQGCTSNSDPSKAAGFDWCRVSKSPPLRGPWTTKGVSEMNGSFFSL